LLAPPAPAGFEDFAGLAKVEAVQSSVQHGELLSRPIRLTQRVAEGPGQVQATRRAHLLSNILQADQANRADVGDLDDAGDQSDGLIAESSSRGEQHRVDLFLAELLGHLGSRLADERIEVRRLDMAHKAEAIGQAADDAALSQTVQQGTWKEDIEVA
jgi:hypothetical protein